MNLKKIIREEIDDFAWINDVGLLLPGQKYDVKSGNGYYWTPYEYVGLIGTDGDGLRHVFNTLDGSGRMRMTKSYAEKLLNSGKIRVHIPNWSIKDELVFSDDIKDVLKGNFVIYFKSCPNIARTISLQRQLFRMGFSFYGNKKGEPIMTLKGDNNIKFIECLNWDTSLEMYELMDPKGRDKKEMLFFGCDRADTLWTRDNTTLADQILFKTPHDHNAIIINGDKYLD